MTTPRTYFRPGYCVHDTRLDEPCNKCRAGGSTGEAVPDAMPDDMRRTEVVVLVSTAGVTEEMRAAFRAQHPNGLPEGPTTSFDCAAEAWALCQGACHCGGRYHPAGEPCGVCSDIRAALQRALDAHLAQHPNGLPEGAPEAARRPRRA